MFNFDFRASLQLPVSGWMSTQLQDQSRRFEGPYFFHDQGDNYLSKHFRNVGQLLLDYKTQYPIRQSSSCLSHTQKKNHLIAKIVRTIVSKCFKVKKGTRMYGDLLPLFFRGYSTI